MTKKILKNFFRAAKFTIKNVIRSLFFICLIAIVLACISWFLLIRYFNAHNLGQIIVNGVQENFGRPVVIREIKLASLNRVQIKGLKIIDDKQEEYSEFLSVDDLTIRYDLIPLLSSKVIIQEIILNSPLIHIIKDEEGVYNIQSLSLASQQSQDGQRFNVKSLSGDNIEVIIEDWIIKNGTFAYKDLKTKTAHSLSGFNAHFLNLKFNDLTDFTSDFIVRNRIEDKIVETGLSLKGKINLANFNTQEMSFNDTQGKIDLFKKPLNFKFNLKDFTAPKIEASFDIPSFGYEDISLLYDKPFKMQYPAFKAEAKLSLEDNFTKLNIGSLQIKNNNLSLQAQGNFDFSSASGKINYKTKEFEISKLTFLTFLKPYKLSGNLLVQGQILYNQGKIKWPSLKADFSKVNAFISNFDINQAQGFFEARDNFDYMTAKVQDGIFKVGRQVISQIKGTTTLEYSKQNFYAQVYDTMLNDKLVKMSVAISNVANPQKRRIKTLIHTSIFEPIEIFELTEDFVYALSDGTSPTAKEEGPLAWLHNFKNNIPKFMPNFSGSLYASELKTPIIYGKDFYAEFALENLLPGMDKLNGKIETSLKEGIIYKLQEAAERQKALGIAFQPFVIMNNMERAGSFKMNKVLKDTPFDIINASAVFANGKMNINNFYLDGKVIAATLGGWVDWHKEDFDLDIYTMFKNTSKRGVLSENLTDESGEPDLAFRNYKTLKDPAFQMKSPKKTGKQIEAAAK
ncbi:MAG: AsmA family protein, partial [Elusimicrobiaceae bacterium]|nr:AsmA family protein [Elusimicrobiaceae bacterium]